MRGGTALTAVTGLLTDGWGTQGNAPATAFRRLAEAWRGRRPTVCATHPSFPASLTSRATQLGAFAEHAYALLGIDEAAQTVDLGNPHGGNHLNRLGMADFLALFADVHSTRDGMPAPQWSPLPGDVAL